MTRLFLGVLGCVLVAAAQPARAASACAAASGRDTLPLVELYTSEGCDSCPAADRWLSSAFPHPRAGATASVLAFHVDYWDRLGWKDRFAAPQFTARQHAAMRANGSTFVYTPQVLVQGRDVDAGRRARAAAKAADARAQPARATIALDAPGFPRCPSEVRRDARRCRTQRLAGTRRYGSLIPTAASSPRSRPARTKACASRTTTSCARCTGRYAMDADGASRRRSRSRRWPSAGYRRRWWRSCRMQRRATCCRR